MSSKIRTALAFSRTKNRALCALLFSFFIVTQTKAATVAIYTNDFESYTDIATSLSDTANANPTSAEWIVVDDVALAPTTAGAGVQVINWLTNSAGNPTKSLLLRPNSEAQVHFRNVRSGSKYQLDFWAYIARDATSDRSFMVILRGEGADYNGNDYIAYRADRVTNSTALFLYDGVKSAPAWVAVGKAHDNYKWQHHRLVIDTRTQMVSVYVDDMNTPVTTTGRVARSEVAVPTMMRIVNEANSADDGYWAIDDISFTVEGSIDLNTTFVEGFESYPARTSPSDDANPQGPWIITEVNGLADGGGRPAAPNKVQVVDSSVIAPHSGSKSLKLEGGQRAGASIAWGQTPQTDVQITWWAYVPQAVPNNPSADAMYLRMSLYGVEGGNSFSGDTALLGYGIRGTTPAIGGPTSLDYFTTTWVDSGVTYTPNVWEEYRLTTHASQGRYTIMKNPSSANPQVVVDRGSLIGTAGTWGPLFMAAWSTSNGTNHPPVYIDDIEIKSLVSNPDPLPTPYNIANHGNRFTNNSILNVSGQVGGVAVDPRDNSTIVFTLDNANGGIYRARKVASGNWSVDPQPLVSGLSNPSGLTIDEDGTIWWVHDFTASLRRLKAPWESNTWEEVISQFGYADTDDDTVDVTIAPASFNGSIGKPKMVVIADRGCDTDPFNAIYVMDRATTNLSQTFQTMGVPPKAGDWQFLIQPTTTGLGSSHTVNAITSLPQYGEIVALNKDGTITAINGDGVTRNIWTATLWSDFWTGGPAPAAQAIATDPTTGRLWIADDLRDEVWSVDPNPATEDAAPDQKEYSFPLTNPSRPDLQLAIHEPGLTFAPNGSFMVLSDTSVVNGGGRLLIFHNDAPGLPTFSIKTVSIVSGKIQLTWESAGAAKYRVQRSATLDNFQDISGDLTDTQFTDTTATGTAFYRVIAKP